MEELAQNEIEETIQDYEVKQAEKIDDDELLRRAVAYSTKEVPVKNVVVVQRKRNAYIAEMAKRRANGKCLSCGEPAPFIDKNGKPYLEAHHLTPLGEGGADSLDNVVALCPNCHRKIHCLAIFEDIEFLRDCVQTYCRNERIDDTEEE